MNDISSGIAKDGITQPVYQAYELRVEYLRTDGAVRAKPGLLELCRVVMEVGESQNWDSLLFVKLLTCTVLWLSSPKLCISLGRNRRNKYTYFT